jgi:hypothetical protein
VLGNRHAYDIAIETRALRTALSCLVTGSVFTVMGIVFLAVGAPEVPVVPEQGKSAIHLEPIVGPTSAGMRVTF